MDLKRLFSGCTGREVCKWKCRASGVLMSHMVVLAVRKGVSSEELSRVITIHLKGGGYIGIV